MSETVKMAASEKRKLLSTKLNELGLTIPGSHLETSINRLCNELDSAGIAFKPDTYLSDSWGCPSEVPIIGIPFYLADPKIYQAVNEFIDPAPWNDTEIIRYLRHECGHALNYAHRLYEDPAWGKAFGPYSTKYRDNYKSIPFDTHFVRHSTGWYAQKHPDEDFAETFAVWLAPDSNWRQVYADTPALAKLLYIHEAVKAFGSRKPCVAGGVLDRPLTALDMTLRAWYRLQQSYGRKKIILPAIIDEDLRRLFPDKNGIPAGAFLKTNNRLIVRAVHDWTGVGHYLLYSLTGVLTRRVKALGLVVDVNRNAELILSTTAFVSTLSMNYQFMGKFVKD
jgi:hypothetical protein